MRLTGIISHGFGKHGFNIRNQVTYMLSSFEQNPTGNMVSKGLPNTIRRIRTRFLTIAIPAFLYYNLYLYTEEAQRKMDRKNPKDYENDV